MKKLFIIVSLFFVSCQTKTDSQVKAEEIQKEERAEMSALPEINTGINTDTLCKY